MITWILAGLLMLFGQPAPQPIATPDAVQESAHGSAKDEAQNGRVMCRFC